MGTGAHSDQTGRGHSLGNTDDTLEGRAATQTALERLEEWDNGDGNSAAKNAKCCGRERRADGHNTDCGIAPVCLGNSSAQEGLGSCWAHTGLSQQGALAAGMANSLPTCHKQGQ